MTEYLKTAAEKAIHDLQDQVDHAQDSAARAETSAARAETSANRWKKLTVGALALAVVVAVLGTWFFFGLRQQARNSCRIGNDRAMGTVTVIDELVTLLEGPHPTAATKQKAADYEAYVAAHNPQRDCSHVYPGFWLP